MQPGEQVQHNSGRWYTLDSIQDGEAFCSDDSGAPFTCPVGELVPVVED